MEAPGKQHGGSGEKENPEAITYGNKDGRITFGKLRLAGSGQENLAASVVSGVTVEGFDSNHYMSLDNTGERKGWTLQSSPGPHHILCASQTSSSTPGNNDGGGFVLIAEHGDIVIKALRGRVRISGIDVDVRADGYNTKTGTINLESNESVNINTPKLNVETEIGIGLRSTGSIDIVANTALSMVGKFTKGITSASANGFSLSNPFATAEYIEKMGFG
jgi:hypothetical protein